MIGFLKGTLHAVREDHVIVEAHGVGYRVFTTQPTLGALPNVGATVEFEISTIVREDAINLYGFTNTTEMKLYHLLMLVSGIGPRQAVHILSNSRPEDLMRAVSEADTAYLESLRGIGHKTAEKIILELKGPLAKFVKQENALPDVRNRGRGETPFRSDLVAALTQLGYRRNQIDDAIFKLAKDKQHTLQQAIRECLRLLSGNQAGQINNKSRNI